ncbi:short-chain dehydrogenase/reductase SDR [Pyrenochaeta sp. MPI-SDFR-AT-0127]|nr:short-chain dehydrogenase/reductase SDR [Pyrenochaeta sp. MPI-SDFR-AT-0127]
MSSFLVTGASRGIGLSLVTHLASKPISEVSKVFASARSQSDALTNIISKAQGRVEFVELEVASLESVTSASVAVGKSLDGRGLDVLINNAGVMPYTSGGIKNMFTLTPVSRADLDKVLKINVGGVNSVIHAFLPLLRKGDVKKIINVSTTLGSIAMSSIYRQQPTPAYKISKAALNMLTVQYALDLEDAGFTVLAICPGWVRTDLGTDAAHLSVDDSVNSIIDIIKRAGTHQSGKFLTVDVPGTILHGRELYDGSERPW